MFIFWWSTRRPLAVFWWSSNAMIQENVCERLHFYMDSCAISPMASLFWITFNFWWLAEWSEQWMLTETQKNEKGPCVIKKFNVHFWITFNFWCWNASQPWTLYQTIKCSFFDYVWLLIISQVIWATKVAKNVKIMTAKSFLFNWGHQVHFTIYPLPSSIWFYAWTVIIKWNVCFWSMFNFW